MTDEKQGSGEASLLALRPHSQEPKGTSPFRLCPCVISPLLKCIATVFPSISFFNFGVPDLAVMV